MGGIWENIKQHPWLYGGGAVIGVIILYLIFRSGSSGTPVDTGASDYATQTAAATALAQSQLAANSADYKAQQDAAAAQSQIAGAEAIAQIQSNTQLGLGALSADVANKQTAAGTAQTQIAADASKYEASLSAQVATAATAATKATNLAQIAAGVTQSRIASQTSLGLAATSASEHEYLASSAQHEAETLAAYSAQTSQLAITTQGQTNAALIAASTHNADVAAANNATQAAANAANTAALIAANKSAADQAAAQAAQNEKDKLAYASGPGYSLQAFATAMSDRRVKENVKKVGKLPNGLPIYSFNYIWGGEQEVGLMADDVAAFRPDAVMTDVNGFHWIDYSQAVI